MTVRCPRNGDGRAQPLFVAGDIDGFFGLAIDNLIQFLLIQKVANFAKEKTVRGWLI